MVQHIVQTAVQIINPLNNETLKLPLGTLIEGLTCRPPKGVRRSDIPAETKKALEARRSPQKMDTEHKAATAARELAALGAQEPVGKRFRETALREANVSKRKLSDERKVLKVANSNAADDLADKLSAAFNGVGNRSSPPKGAPNPFGVFGPPVAQKGNPFANPFGRGGKGKGKKGQKAKK